MKRFTLADYARQYGCVELPVRVRRPEFKPRRERRVPNPEKWRARRRAYLLGKGAREQARAEGLL